MKKLICLTIACLLSFVYAGDSLAVSAWYSQLQKGYRILSPVESVKVKLFDKNRNLIDSCFTDSTGWAVFDSAYDVNYYYLFSQKSNQYISDTIKVSLSYDSLWYRIPMYLWDYRAVSSVYLVVPVRYTDGAPAVGKSVTAIVYGITGHPSAQQITYTAVTNANGIAEIPIIPKSILQLKVQTYTSKVWRVDSTEVADTIIIQR